MSHDIDSASSPTHGTRQAAARRSSKRRYAPWTLLACFGVAGAKLVSNGAHAPVAHAEGSLTVQPEGGAARPGPNPMAMVATAAIPLDPQLLPVKVPAPPPDDEDTLENAAEDEAEDDEDAPRRAGPAPPEVAEWRRRAGPYFPGQTWRDAVNTADWPNVASLIDALPEAERNEPGTRYARALAARELDQCPLALQLLNELESSLPLLHDEIQAARAHCQLEVGPHEEAYQYFMREQSPDNLILAARASVNGGDLARADQAVDRALSKLQRLRSTKRNTERTVKARRLRAEIAEARGHRKSAARDWLWLAKEAPDHALAEGADANYERLSGNPLSKLQRFARMRTFSLSGDLDLALRERSQLAAAPGRAPEELDVTITLAWAYYHSRRDYLKAAELFHKASELSAATRSKYLYYEARALSRANLDLKAIEKYTELIERAPGGYAEQAHFRIARLYYGLGQWGKAVTAYDRYLERYARNGGGKYARACRYELAISQLGAKVDTDEAAVTLGKLAKRERRAERRALLTHLEGVALETTREPKKMLEALQRYRSVIDDLPISFAALASAARLRGLGRDEPLRASLARSFASAPKPSFTPELPEKARVLKELGLHTDAERALFEERRQVRRKYSESEGRALCELYSSLDRGYRAYSFADYLFRSQELGLTPSTENLWAWHCAYPRPYREVVDAVEERYQLPEWLVYAVMRQESGFRPHVKSPVGAVGLMQLMPTTARLAAEEITARPGAPWVPDPNRRTSVLDNVELGGFYLGKLLGLLAGQLPAAVAAYNAGPSAVSRWLEAGQDLPTDVWVGRIPYTETRDYVMRVLGNWLAYRYLDDPENLPQLQLALAPGSSEAADCY